MRIERLIFAATLIISIAYATESNGQNILLIPDSTNDQVSSFDPSDGSLISLDFIPNTGGFMTPLNAISSGRGTVFVSDQVADVVFEFGYDGNLIGTVADASDGLDNIRGIEVFNNRLYVTVGGNAGGLDNTIQTIDLIFGTQLTFATVNGPFDVLVRGADVLATNTDDDDIARFDLSGNPMAGFHDSDGLSGINFPEQISLTGNGDILAAGFNSSAGVYRYDSIGNQIAYFDVGEGVRGVYELGNGNILWTGSSGVNILNPLNGLSSSVVSGADYRFIERVSTIPEPGGLAVLVGCGVAGLLRRRRS